MTVGDDVKNNVYKIVYYNQENCTILKFNLLFLIDKNIYSVGAIVGHTIPYVSVG
ncbi:hypothetical protein LOCUS_36530 [Klebsiella pneumoniae]|nr:hypothetical protein JUNP254_2965 [Klebsiella pneumoniae]BCI95795.1 hypothetical protein VNKP15269_C27890 [Klebsiella pneumoniae]GMW13087.1 hypothetical protein LOCUS_48590 [Klebsiella pneumoniae]GMW17088.1 hypothetical protein LOCUS_34450 [Klebsiella pneumoniae]GMW28403.1 hypothetical protein LOCUS_44380 [Klebsiella pneumoniae]